MKYIRTKDNIFEVENEKPNHIIFCKPRHTQMLVAISDNKYEMRNIVIEREIGKSNWKTEIIKQADTIEELCDEFVLINKKDKTHFIDTLSPDIYDYKDYEIYGAIWTDKGLIYVAKMNDKGELELI